MKPKLYPCMVVVRHVIAPSEIENATEMRDGGWSFYGSIFELSYQLYTEKGFPIGRFLRLDPPGTMMHLDRLLTGPVHYLDGRRVRSS